MTCCEPILDAISDEFSGSKASLHIEHRREFVEPQWKCCHSLYPFKVWKGFLAIYFTIWLLIDLAYLPRDSTVKPDRKYLVYLTNWTYLLFTLYTIVSAINTCTYDPPKNANVYKKIDGPLWPLKLQWILWNVGAVSTTGVMILYWTLLGENLHVFSLHKHLINGIIIVIDHFFIAMPVHLLHVYQSMIYGVLYATFTAVYFLADKTVTPIYRFLDFKNNLGMAVGTEAAVVFVLLPVLHLLFWLLYKLRVFIVRHAGTPRSTAPGHSIPAPDALARVPPGPRPVFIFTVEDADADRPP